MLRCLARHQIDDKAYDRCVAFSPQRLIYAFSWYLDAVSPDWEALVEDEYTCVMPLPIRWRYGVKSVIQPLFCHQLGVFSAGKTPDTVTLSRFLQFLSQQVRYIPSYQFNAENTAQLTADSGQFIPLTNHVLNLQKPYDELVAGYTKDRKTNLKRGLQRKWDFVETDDVTPLITLFRYNNTGGIGRVASGAYDQLRRLVLVLQDRQQVTIRMALHNGQVEAGCLLVTDVNRVIHLFCAASPEGRKGNARTLILDQCIRDYAGKPMTFDFESPQVENLAAFNRSFGAEPEFYSRFVHNQLPGPVRFLHRMKKWLHQTVLP